MIAIFLRASLALTAGVLSTLAVQAQPILDARDEAAGPVPEELVQEIEPWIEGAGRVAWSPDGRLVAFDRRDADGRYDVWLRLGEEGADRCLTCRMVDFRQTNVLNPTWHASGDYLVVQVQRHPRKLDLDDLELATPHRGLHSDLYVVWTDGSDFSRLTQTGEIGSAVLDPHFSYDGNLLVWSQRTTTRSGRWGGWQLQTARLKLSRGVPRLDKIRQLKQLGDRGVLVAHEFTPDDGGLLFTGHLEAGQSDSGLDVYEVRLDGAAPERKTHSRTQIDEIAHITPQGDHVVWTSNSELFPRTPPRHLPPTLLRDLWIMRRDGSEKQRLTHFNDDGYPESQGEAYVGDFAFSPSGDRLAVHVITPGSLGEPRQALWLVTLVERFRR